MSTPPWRDQNSQKCLNLDLKRTKNGNVLIITLNRPKAYNAVSMEMLNELHNVLDHLEHPTSMQPLDPDFPRVVIIKSAGGKAFSGGVDIKAADKGIGGQSWNYYDIRSQQLLSRLIEKLRHIPQPVISAIQGVAAGAGFAIALASDIRIATKDSSFSAAFVKLGLTGTDMGSSFFTPKIAGLGIAAEMLLTGNSVKAERAYQVGLVNELVESGEQLDEAANKMAEAMLTLSPKGLQLTKEQLNSVADGGSLRTALTSENSHQILLVNDDYSKKIAQAWLNSVLGKSSQRSKM